MAGEYMDTFQTGLDVVGLVPGFGEPVDLVNGSIYAARGQYANAGLSYGAAIPFVGWGATIGKFANKADNAADLAKQVPDISVPYQRPSGATTAAQRESVQGQPCVDCGAITSRQVADHKTPLVKEYYESGTIDVQRMRSLDAVQPQCPTCSARQGAEMSRYSQQQKKELGL